MSRILHQLVQLPAQEPNELMTTLARKVCLYVFPGSFLFQLSHGSFHPLSIILFLLVMANSLPSPRATTNALRTCCYLLLPIQAALGASALIPTISWIPTSILLPTTSALVHSSVGEHMSIVLFANMVVLFSAEIPLECTVSMSATVLSTIIVCAKCVWIRTTGSLPEEVIRDWKTPLLIAIVILLTMFGLRFHQLYPDFIWQLAETDGDTLRIARKFLACTFFLGTFACWVYSLGSESPIEVVYIQLLTILFIL